VTLGHPPIRPITLIDRHVGPDGKEGYSIEVLNAVGDTVGVTVVDEDAIEALQSDEVLSVWSAPKIFSQCAN
jgi:hypothetical protein